MIGDIMGISRLRMATDGQGVSTLISFFGCPLHCKYCINNHCHDGEDSDTLRAAYTPEELADVLKKDEIYYLMTGGGIVFGGGEPLLQSTFIHEVCEIVNPLWKKRIETSLNVPWRQVEPVLSDIDEWIVDIKDINALRYQTYTGCSNQNLIQNLRRMQEKIAPEKWHIRIPRIKQFNQETDIHASEAWVKKHLGVEPEIFDYLVFPQTK